MSFKNWRTTVGGLMAALGTIAISLPIPYAHEIGVTLAALGQVLLGLTAMDAKNGPPK